MSGTDNGNAPRPPVLHRDQVRDIDSNWKDLDALAPLHAYCERIVVSKPKSDDDWQRIAALRNDRPDVRLYLWGIPVTNLEMLRFFPDLGRLTVHVPNLESLDGLRHIESSLRALELDPGNTRLSVKPVAACARLTSLHLKGRSKDFESLLALVQLTSLGLGGHSMADLAALLPYRHLRSLYLGFCNALDLHMLGQFPELEALHLQKINKLQSLAGIETAHRLRRIELGWLPHVETLPDLAPLAGLDEFEVAGMKSLRDIAGIAAAPALRYLALWDCGALTPEAFSCLAGHPTLRHLEWGIGARKKNEAVGAMFPKAMQGTVPYKKRTDTVLRRPTP